MPCCQQDELYAAELGLDDGPCFESLHAAQVFVDGLRDTDWWIKWLNEIERVEVGPARSGAKFAGVGWYEREKQCGRMEFTTCRPSLRLIVHELAHVVASCRRMSESHDPWMARIYLELTYLIMGSAAYKELEFGYLAQGIDYDAGGITDWTRN